MANNSIYSAFERMWQHVLNALGNKSDVGHTHDVVSTTANGFAPKRDGSTTKFLRADGTWAVPPTGSTITVDSSLSSTSTNPVQNKVINSALSGKLSTTGTAAKATADANGNNIVNTYATKTELANMEGQVYLDDADTNASAEVINADTLGGIPANQYATKAELTTVEDKLAGGWVSFTDADGNPTTEPYFHWYE